MLSSFSTHVACAARLLSRAAHTARRLEIRNHLLGRTSMMNMIKTIWRLLNASLFFVCLLAVATFAQSEDERDIVSKFQSGQATGMKVTILLAGANGSLTAVDPKRECSPGEEIKVALESNMRGYVYLVSFGSSGKNSVVFPDVRAEIG